MAQGIKTGGREPGTPNKISAEVKDVLKKVINKQLETLEDDLNTLSPKEKWFLISKLLPFIVSRELPLDDIFQNDFKVTLNLGNERILH